MLLNKHGITDSRVAAAGGVIEERLTTNGCIIIAFLLLKSAYTPMAVLFCPMALLNSANPPLAVLPPPEVLLKRAPATGSCIFAGGIGKERSSADTRAEATVCKA